MQPTRQGAGRRPSACRLLPSSKTRRAWRTRLCSTPRGMGMHVTASSPSSLHRRVLLPRNLVPQPAPTNPQPASAAPYADPEVVSSPSPQQLQLQQAANRQVDASGTGATHLGASATPSGVVHTVPLTSPTESLAAVSIHAGAPTDAPSGVSTSLPAQQQQQLAPSAARVTPFPSHSLAAARQLQYTRTRAAPSSVGSAHTSIMGPNPNMAGYALTAYGATGGGAASSGAAATVFAPSPRARRVGAAAAAAAAARLRQQLQQQAQPQQPQQLMLDNQQQQLQQQQQQQHTWQDTNSSDSRNFASEYTLLPSTTDAPALLRQSSPASSVSGQYVASTEAGSHNMEADAANSFASTRNTADASSQSTHAPSHDPLHKGSFTGPSASSATSTARRSLPGGRKIVRSNAALVARAAGTAAIAAGPSLPSTGSSALQIGQPVTSASSSSQSGTTVIQGQSSSNSQVVVPSSKKRGAKSTLYKEAVADLAAVSDTAADSSVAVPEPSVSLQGLEARGGGGVLSSDAMQQFPGTLASAGVDAQVRKSSGLTSTPASAPAVPVQPRESTKLATFTVTSIAAVAKKAAAKQAPPAPAPPPLPTRKKADWVLSLEKGTTALGPSSSGSSKSSTAKALTEGTSGVDAVTASRKAPVVFGSSDGRSMFKNLDRGSSGSSSKSVIRTPELVLRHGQWVLEGAEDDLDGLEAKVPSLQARLLAAVKAEQDTERKALQQLYSAGSLKRLRREGAVLTGLAAAPAGELYSSTLWTFTAATAAVEAGIALSPSSSASSSSRSAALSRYLGSGSGSSTGVRGARGGAGGAGGSELPYHKFKVGDTLLVTRWDTAAAANFGREPAQDSGAWRSASGTSNGASGALAGVLEGTVLEVRRAALVLAFDSAEAEALEAAVTAAQGCTWRLDHSARDTTTQRQVDAIHRLAEYTCEGGAGAGGQGALAGAAASERLMRCVMVGTRNAALLAEQPPLWVRSDTWRSDARAALAAQTGLNSSQRRAVAKAMVSSLTLWQGPPGTGKTRTLLALLQVLVSTTGMSPARQRAMGTVLACADTNAAVDNLVRGLVQRGIQVVRVGAPAKVSPELRHLTLEAAAEATRAGAAAAARRDAARKDLQEYALLRTQPMEDLARQRLAAAEGAARAAIAAADAALRDAQGEVLDKAQVVCATCTGSSDRALSGRSFRMVVVDEATQATEPAALIPLTRGVQCVVMAGDPKQLPPTVVSVEAHRLALDVTLFDRISEAGVSPLLLDTQYRMHPAISAFPSNWFYASKLLNGVQAADKPPPKGLVWPQRGLPVAVVPVEDGVEERATTAGVTDATDDNDAAAGVRRGGGGRQEPGRMHRAGRDASGDGGGSGGGGDGGGVSYRNVAEARVALRAVHALLRAGDVSSAAILTPYKGQVRLLESLLRTHAAHFAGFDIVVSSVDGYQGREADVVVFTTVRCNARGGIGFVADARRLNVAITRPRRGLLVVGSPSTLQRGSRDWAAYLQWAQEEGVHMDRSRLPAAPWEAPGSNVAAVLSEDDTSSASDVGEEALLPPVAVQCADALQGPDAGAASIAEGSSGAEEEAATAAACAGPADRVSEMAAGGVATIAVASPQRTAQDTKPKGTRSTRKTTRAAGAMKQVEVAADGAAAADAGGSEPATEAAAETKPKRTRSSRKPAKAIEDEGAPADAAALEKKPKRSTGTTKGHNKADEAADGVAASADAGHADQVAEAAPGTKPKRTRSKAVRTVK